jgi:hypothetical protein
LISFRTPGLINLTHAPGSQSFDSKKTSQNAA